jgi:hypothetical protein
MTNLAVSSVAALQCLSYTGQEKELSVKQPAEDSRPSEQFEETRSPMIIPSVFYGSRDTKKEKNESFFGAGIKAFVPYKNVDVSLGIGASSGGSSLGEDYGLDLSYGSSRGARISAGISNYGPSSGLSKGPIFLGANISGPLIKYRLPFIPVGPGFGEFDIGASPAWVSAGIFSSSTFSPIAAGAISFIEAFKSSRGIREASKKIEEVKGRFEDSKDPFERAYFRYMHDFFSVEKAGFERNWGTNTSKIPLLNLLTAFGGSNVKEISDSIGERTRETIENIDHLISDPGIMEAFFDGIPNNIPSASVQTARVYSDKDISLDDYVKRNGVFAKAAGVQDELVSAVVGPFKKAGRLLHLSKERQDVIVPEEDAMPSIQEGELETVSRKKFLEEALYLAYRGLSQRGTDISTRGDIGKTLSSLPGPAKEMLQEAVRSLPEELERQAEQRIKVKVSEGGQKKPRKVHMSGGNFVLMSLKGDEMSEMLRIEKMAASRVKNTHVSIDELAVELDKALRERDEELIYETALCLFILAMKDARSAGLVAEAVKRISPADRAKLSESKEKIADYLNNRRRDFFRLFGMGRTKIKAIVPGGRKWNFDIDDYVSHVINAGMDDLGKLLEAEGSAINTFKSIKKRKGTELIRSAEQIFGSMKDSINTGNKAETYQHAAVLFMIATLNPELAAIISGNFKSLDEEQRSFLRTLTDPLVDFCQSRQPGILRDFGIIKKVKISNPVKAGGRDLTNLDKYEYVERTINGTMDERLNDVVPVSDDGDSGTDRTRDGLWKTLNPENDFVPPGSVSDIEREIGSL